MATDVEKQEFTFQAEIKQLLHLLAHSLYQSKEIALRELVSNASDALDKMRYVSLTDESQRDSGSLEIIVEGQPGENLLFIRDNGVGMTHDEIVSNLGTIARSGSLEFVKNLTDAAGSEAKTASGKPDLSLIGQFGVGFYSAFMLADRVRVRSRSYREESGWEWESDGSGTFSVTPVEGLPRGTEVILHLKMGVMEYAHDWKIKEVLKKYSSFVPHPIRVAGDVVNNQKPIWVEPKAQVTDEQHREFYQYLTHRSDETPLWRLHMSVDSPIQFQAIFYCPATNIESFGFGRAEHGLNLCAKRVLVQSDCQELVPDYMRFLYGLVDSEDLPLNVSRETLQDSTVIRRIRTSLVKGVIDRLQKLAEEAPDEYLTFYRQFGAFLKEGVATDHANSQRLAKLLRIASTHSEDPDQPTSLDQYIERSKPDQKAIYYLGGLDLNALRKSPNLEIFRKRGLEVLLLTDAIDEFVMSGLLKYEDRELASIDVDELELPEGDGPKPEEDESTSPGSESGFHRVLELFRTALGDRVREVRESKRLTDSPCCLVNADGGLSTQMQRLLKQAHRDVPVTHRILEVNPKASLVKALGGMGESPENDAFIKDCALQLWTNALALEGVLSEPQEMVSRVQSLMEDAARAKTAGTA